MLINDKRAYFVEKFTCLGHKRRINCIFDLLIECKGLKDKNKKIGDALSVLGYVRTNINVRIADAKKRNKSNTPTQIANINRWQSDMIVVDELRSYLSDVITYFRN